MISNDWATTFCVISYHNMIWFCSSQVRRVINAQAIWKKGLIRKCLLETKHIYNQFSVSSLSNLPWIDSLQHLQLACNPYAGYQWASLGAGPRIIVVSFGLQSLRVQCWSTKGFSKPCLHGFCVGIPGNHQRGTAGNSFLTIEISLEKMECLSNPSKINVYFMTKHSNLLVAAKWRQPSSPKICTPFTAHLSFSGRNIESNFWGVIVKRCQVLKTMVSDAWDNFPELNMRSHIHPLCRDEISS